MNSISKTALGGVGFAIAMLASVSAQAVTPIPVDPVTGGTFGNQPCPEASCFFTNLYTFVVPFPRIATVTFFSNSVNFPVDNVNIDNPTGAKLNGVNFAVINNGNPESRTITQLIGAGTQNLRFDGSAGRDGTYSGTISFAGVPEPMTWALMIVGFGMVGGSMRRKSAVTTKVAYA